jgi:hypothetical protein
VDIKKRAVDKNGRVCLGVKLAGKKVYMTKEKDGTIILIPVKKSVDK